jgi:excisionase family DNA binding protein
MENEVKQRGDDLMQMDNRWVTINEAARYIGMSVGFIRKAVRNQAIPFCRVGSKSLRFDRAALDSWMAASGDAAAIASQKN